MRLPSLSAAHPMGPPPPGPAQSLSIYSGMSIAMIAVVTVIQLVTQVLDVVWFEALETASQQEGDGIDRADVIEIASALLSMVWFLALLLSAGSFILWLYRARTNLEILGISGFKRSRGWVIGSWFIPFANFVLPFGMVAEVSRASDPSFEASRPASDARRTESLLACWWAAWIGMAVSSQVYSQVYFSAGGSEGSPAAILEDRGAVLLVGGLNTVLTVTAAILAVQVIRRVTQRQQARITRAAMPPVGTFAVAGPLDE